MFCCAVVQSCLTLCDSIDCSTLGFTISRSMLKLLSFESVMPFNHLVFCHPLLLPSIFPSVRVFSNESALHIRWPENWNFSFSISPSNEYSGLISFRMASLISLQSKGLSRVFSKIIVWASVLWCSAFIMVQLSYPYMTTGKTALTTGTSVSRVMSLLFNMLSRLVIAFLPRSKSLNFMAAITTHSDFGAQENRVCHCFHCFSIYCHEVMGWDAKILIFWMLSFKPDFSLSSFTFKKRLFSSSLLSAREWCHLHIWAYCMYSAIIVPLRH